MSSSYDRGRRGGHNSGGGRDRDYDRRDRNDSRDRKRPRDEGDRRPPRGKFQKRGGRGRGRGRKQPEPEFRDVIVTKPNSCVSKTVHRDDPMAEKDQKLQLLTNYFRVDTKKNVSMTQYRIDFDDSIQDRRRKFAIVGECTHLLGLHVYDGANMVFLMRKLNDKRVTKRVQLRDGSEYNVTFRETREILYTDSMFFTVLNLIVRRCFEKLNLTLVGRNYYDAAQAQRVQELRIDLWPGFKTSIRQHEQQSLLLCCELTYKMMRPSNIWEIIKELLQTRGAGAYRDETSRQIIGKTVLTTYNNKNYRVNDIDWSQNLGNAFFLINGREKSYIEYYRERYNIENLDPNQPLLTSKAKAKHIRGGSGDIISLVPQLCQATGIDDSMRNNFQTMRKLSQYTRMNPAERVSKLNNFNKRLQDNPECRATFKDNHLELDCELVTVDARRMEQEVVYFGNGKKKLHDDVQNPADWTHSFRDHEMFTCMPLTRWVFICTKRCESDSRAFLELLIQMAKKLGMEVSDSYKIEILPDDRNETYMNALQNFIKMDPLFIVIVVENNRADRYAAIKRKCCIQTPVPVQVLCWKTFADSKRGIASVATKVAIQINCKLGGIPWLIKIPLKGLLVIGFDVTHDSDNKFKSVGAMVASMNPQQAGGKFFCCAMSHENGEQISQFFGAKVITAIQKYKQLNGALPETIIIYRDGVGDGQIEYVDKCEVKDIESKVTRLYNSDKNSETRIKPKIAFIIVNKRINTRFFIRSGSNGRAENPLPGTVCDSVVTLPERYDFYLISQSVTQGTVAPISYNIIYDTTGLPPCRMQQLSFKLCHTYFNWSGTTRVPSVVQYAKKLSLLIGQYLHREPTEFSDDKMLYFL